jgi:putative acetyltransferase
VTTNIIIRIREVDPQGEEARELLKEAAAEARELYPEVHSPGTPLPTNAPTPAGGAYLIGYLEGQPVACGSLRPLTDTVVEIRRMFVIKSARRRGVGRAVLEALESAADRFGYRIMRLETGNRQLAAMALYTSYGFTPIEPFGEHVNDPTSVCYEKTVRVIGDN